MIGQPIPRRCRSECHIEGEQEEEQDQVCEQSSERFLRVKCDTSYFFETGEELLACPDESPQSAEIDNPGEYQLMPDTRAEEEECDSAKEDHPGGIRDEEPADGVIIEFDAQPLQEPPSEEVYKE